LWMTSIDVNPNMYGYLKYCFRVRVIVFNATFNTISVIS
jgi:hypothetical protein